MDVFGGSTGGIVELAEGRLSNGFHSIASNDIDTVINSNRVQPRQISTGITRGTWRINNSDGSYITIGSVPGSNDKFGISFFEADGTEWARMGGLPDDTNNIVLMKPGYSVEDAFS